MKFGIRTAATLLAFVAAFGIFSASAETQKIDATVDQVITITPPTDISGWVLSPANTQPEEKTGIQATIASNVGTKLTVSASGSNSGCFNFNDGSSHSLANPLYIKSNGPLSGTVYLESALTTGSRTHTFDYQQTVTYGDAPSTAYYDYRYVCCRNNLKKLWQSPDEHLNMFIWLMSLFWWLTNEEVCYKRRRDGYRLLLWRG